MAYLLNEINRRVKVDPLAFVLESDAGYEKNVETTADLILNHMGESRIVLLSGPSGSGKTTTAKNLELALEKRGVETHTVSMDNYFLDVDPVTSPRDEHGEYDFESPACLDSQLLQHHFAELDHGREVMIPKFDFTIQKRRPEKAVPLRLGEHEIAIFEGIHALNDQITGANGGSHAAKVYISARSDIINDGKVIFKGTWMRIVRRAIRDMQFRGAAPSVTFKMWESVRRGEKKYISPYKQKADVIFDTALPYEVPLLKNYSDRLFTGLDPTISRYAEILDIQQALCLFEALDEAYVPPTSLLREFIGGGSHRY